MRFLATLITFMLALFLAEPYRLPIRMVTLSVNEIIPIVATGIMGGVVLNEVSKLERTTKTAISKLEKTTTELEKTSTATQAEITFIKTALLDIKAGAEATQNRVSNILIAFGLFVGILGGSKTVFESIEYLPTIPEKIRKSVKESDAKENKELRMELKVLKDMLKSGDFGLKK
mmetsp:Transcript_31680/g.43225  ORF Transcript_31680/g.43225 Transcript_31680/m.43225 type:complete len:174 (+) Transcript_31680:67-588(+)